MEQRRRNQIFSPEFITGKIPPQALELEEGVLGALMLEKNAYEEIADFLRFEMFYKDANQYIYKSIVTLYSKNSPVDILTVTNQLRQDGTLEICGGPYYITQLTNRVSSAANIEFHARIIEQKYIQRELIRISGEIQREAFEETSDCYELIENLEKQISVLQSNGTEIKQWKTQLKEAQVHLESINRDTGISGIASGFKAIDNVLKGFQNGEVIILGARPGMGKSAWLIKTALNIAKQKIPVDIYSLEMAGLQLILRAISSESGINSDKLKADKLNELDWLSITRTIGNLSDLPIHLDDIASQKPLVIKRKVKKGVKDRGTKIIFIDYLQLMDGSDTENGKANRTTQIGHISRTLKQVAKECNIPVIALASLSRSVEQRGGEKKPMLSDLRESGDIESDADVVAFLYRPEYYGFLDDKEGNSLVGIAEFIIAKHRNGATDTCLIKFDAKHSTFTDLNVNDFFIGAKHNYPEPPEKDDAPF